MYHIKSNKVFIINPNLYIMYGDSFTIKLTLEKAPEGYKLYKNTILKELYYFNLNGKFLRKPEEVIIHSGRELAYLEDPELQKIFDFIDLDYEKLQEEIDTLNYTDDENAIIMSRRKVKVALDIINKWYQVYPDENARNRLLIMPSVKEKIIKNLKSIVEKGNVDD